MDYKFKRGYGNPIMWLWATSEMNARGNKIDIQHCTSYELLRALTSYYDLICEDRLRLAFL
jgi:hypothetical protein